MKLLSKHIDKYSGGDITLITENEEDMWTAYNLIQVGDRIRSSTMRKVHNETATGSVVTKQVRTILTIEIEGIDFDAQGSTMSLKGRNVQENQWVKMGAYHTLVLSINDKFSLYKAEWDTITMDLVEQAADPSQNSDLAAVVMQEGLAYVCLITNSMTLVRSKIDVNIPRKRKGITNQHDKGINRYFDQIMQALERHIRFEVVKCIILASPGFVKDQFYEYLFREAVKQDKKVFLDNKGKFLLVHSSSGHKHALREALLDPVVLNKMSDTKAAGELKALNDFFQMMKMNPDKAFYGVKHVEAAAEAMAIETLLVSDSLFRSQDLATRKRYVAIVDSVKENMGTVRIFSSLHVSGEQLNNLSGIAAILRFPIPEPPSSDDSDSDS